MIKCEVVVDGNSSCINGWYYYSIGDEWEVVKGDLSDQFVTLEDAIQYCLEQSQ